jgi:hypothetical protein
LEPRNTFRAARAFMATLPIGGRSPGCVLSVCEATPFRAQRRGAKIIRTFGRIVGQRDGDTTSAIRKVSSVALRFIESATQKRLRHDYADGGVRTSSGFAHTSLDIRSDGGESIRKPQNSKADSLGRVGEPLRTMRREPTRRGILPLCRFAKKESAMDARPTFRRTITSTTSFRYLAADQIGHRIFNCCARPAMSENRIALCRSGILVPPFYAGA